MEQERTQYYGHFNVRFEATRVVVLRDNHLKLRSLQLHDDGKINWQIHDLLIEIYDRMLAQDRPCEMVIAVSDPLTRAQAERFNDQNGLVANAVGSGAALGFPVGWLKTRSTVGFLAKYAMENVLESRHAGDVIISVNAWVSGGIGPQHTSKALLIKAQGGRQ
jgi:hypothetical protein